MAFQLSTLHIFGYGETQVIGSNGDTNVNKKVATSSLTKAQAVIDNVYSFKPADNTSPNVFFAINIFAESFADYLPQAEYSPWRTPYSGLDKAAIDALVAEVLAAP
jgi:hypothetical protein